MSTNNPSGNIPTNNPQPQQNQYNWVPTPGGQWFTISIGGGGGGFGIVSSTPEKAEAKKKNKDGCDCKKCKEYFPYAEPNQDDGTLVCYKCRIGW